MNNHIIFRILCTDNMLLTGIIDTDYLEILYRKKFMVGKPNEHIYKNN